MPARVVVDDVRAPLPDGTQLATDVAYVDDGVPRPTLLVRTPYNRVGTRQGYDPVGLARAGWSVALQDVRGRFDSSGDFTPFDQEADDGVAAVAWCAAQPWSDGRVVTTGGSYLGAAQWAAASRTPPALHAVNPWIAPATPAHEWLWHGDAFQIGLGATWTLGVLATSGDEATAARATELLGSVGDALTAAPDDDPVAALAPHYRAWRLREQPAASYLPTTVPALQVVGWYDVFAESGVAAHRSQHDAGIPVVTIVGPWAHDESLTDVFPELDFGPQGNGGLADVRGQSLRWLRDRLDGAPAESEIRYFVMGLGEWRTAATWPPATSPHVLHLGADGRLADRPDDTAATCTWPHRWTDPVPSCGGRVLGPVPPLPGPADQRLLEARDDVLVFSSDVVKRTVVVTGDVVAELTLTSTAPTMDVVVKLCDVHPDGRSFNVVDDIQRVTLTPGRPTSVRVAVGATAHAFLPGHRIRVHVCGSSFARYDVNPRTDARHTLHVGGQALSSVVLPVSR